MVDSKHRKTKDSPRGSHAATSLPRRHSDSAGERNSASFLSDCLPLGSEDETEASVGNPGSEGPKDPRKSRLKASASVPSNPMADSVKDPRRPSRPAPVANAAEHPPGSGGVAAGAAAPAAGGGPGAVDSAGPFSGSPPRRPPVEAGGKVWPPGMSPVSPAPPLPEDPMDLEGTSGDERGRLPRVPLSQAAWQKSLEGAVVAPFMNDSPFSQVCYKLLVVLFKLPLFPRNAPACLSKASVARGCVLCLKLQG